MASAAVWLLVLAPLRADLIDRTLAIVGDQVVMLSDVRAFRELGLIQAGVPDDPQADPLAWVINRTLILTEAHRFVVAEPDPAVVQQRVDAVRARFDTPEAFEALLRELGMTDARLRRIVRDEVRIERYLRQRFTSAGEPTTAEVASYYRAHEDAYRRDGRTPSFAEVRAAVRRDLLEARRQRLIADWLVRVRRRVIVTRLDHRD